MRTITIGRDPHNTIVINDPMASRSHCQIMQYDNGQFVIADMGSCNGTFVNGARISSPVLLNWGDSVCIGNTQLNWQSYFIGNAAPLKKPILPIVVGSITALLVVITSILIVSNDNIFRQFFNKESSVVYPVSFSGTNLDLNMNLSDIRRANPKANLQPQTAQGVMDEINSVEDFDYYNFYNENNERTCVYVTDKSNIVNSINILSPKYHTGKNISIGSTWGDLETTYPDGEWIYFNHSYDFYTSSYYHTWFYYYVPSICTYFIFKGTQFTESQVQSLYQAVRNDKIHISSLSSSVYSSIRSSITVYSICITRCNNSCQSQTITEIQYSNYIKHRLTEGDYYGFRTFIIQNVSDVNLVVEGAYLYEPAEGTTTFKDGEFIELDHYWRSFKIRVAARETVDSLHLTYRLTNYRIDKVYKDVQYSKTTHINKPDDVAIAYAKAMFSGDFEAPLKYVSATYQEKENYIKRMSGRFDSGLQQLQEDYNVNRVDFSDLMNKAGAQFNVTHRDIRTYEAVIGVKMTATDDFGKIRTFEKNIPLVLVNREWMVNKSDIEE